MLDRDRAAAVRWLKALAAAEYFTADECRGRMCADAVCEYHRNRASAFIDAALAIDGEIYLEKKMRSGAVYEDPEEKPPSFRTELAGEAGARRAVFLEYAGARLTLAEWARRTGLTPQVISSRRRMGWSVERILETPLGPPHAPPARKDTEAGTVPSHAIRDDAQEAG